MGVDRGSASDAADRPGSYVGLVRGINVGVGNRISMADFRAVFEGLGYSGVKTLLQSGNVVFDAGRGLTLDDVAAIEKAFAERAGFRAGFVVLGASQFLEILDANPLLDVGADLSRLVITFLPQAPDDRGAASRTPAPGAAAVSPRATAPSDTGTAPSGTATAPSETGTGTDSAEYTEPPTTEAIALPEAADILPEVLAAGTHAIYSWHPDGISNSRLPASFWKQLGPVYTARNVNTANKIAAILTARHPG